MPKTTNYLTSAQKRLISLLAQTQIKKQTGKHVALPPITEEELKSEQERGAA